MKRADTQTLFEVSGTPHWQANGGGWGTAYDRADVKDKAPSVADHIGNNGTVGVDSD